MSDKIKKLANTFDYRKQWRHSLLKKDLEPFHGLPTDVKLILVFVTYRMAFQILPRIYFSCGGVAGNVSVKNILIRMFGPSTGVVFELRPIISNQKWANAWMVLRWFIITDILLNNKNGSDGKCSQCARFWLNIIKGILFGVWDLLQNSFVSGNIYRLRKNIIKSNLTHFTWC